MAHSFLVIVNSNPHFVGRIIEKVIKLNEENERAKESRKETRRRKTKIILGAKETKKILRFHVEKRRE